MSYGFERIVYAPFSGRAIEVAIVATEKSIISEGAERRVQDDMRQVRETQELGSFIVMAIIPATNAAPVWAGALPVSIDGHTGVLRTGLVGNTSFERVERRTHIAYNLVSTALSHLNDIEGITHVRAEAPYELQATYLPHGLAIGATTELAMVLPIRGRTGAAH